MTKDELNKQLESQAAIIQNLTEENHRYRREINNLKSQISIYEIEKEQAIWISDTRDGQIKAIGEYFNKLKDSGIEELIVQRIVQTLIETNKLIF